MVWMQKSRGLFFEVLLRCHLFGGHVDYASLVEGPKPISRKIAASRFIGHSCGFLGVVGGIKRHDWFVRIRAQKWCQSFWGLGAAKSASPYSRRRIPQLPNNQA